MPSPRMGGLLPKMSDDRCRTGEEVAKRSEGGEQSRVVDAQEDPDDVELEEEDESDERSLAQKPRCLRGRLLFC